MNKFTIWDPEEERRRKEMMPMDTSAVRPRRVDQQSILELLKGTPSGMPSGQAPPQVNPVVLPGKPAIPDKQKILDMIRGATAKEPLATTAPPMGVAPEMRPPDPLNQGELQRPNDPRFSQGKVFESGLAAPNDPTDVSGGAQGRPWKAGYGVGETNPLKREAARIRGMIENPISEVNPDGSVKPPHPMSKKKAFLIGLLKGISEAGGQRGEHTWGSIIGGGGAGAATGAISPRSIQEWQRRDDVAQAQGDLSQQQKLAKGQADIEEQQAQTEQRKSAPAIAAADLARQTMYENERLKIQREAAEGTKSAAQATRELRGLEIKERAERGRLDRESREKVAGMPPRIADTGPKRRAKIDESSSLYKKADAIDANANALDAHIKKLEDGMATVPEFIDLGTATDPKVVQNPARESFKTQLKELRDKQEDQRKEARGLRTKGDSARSEGESIPEGSIRGTAPTTHSFSISAYMSRNKGETAADARAFAAKNYPTYEVVD